MNTGRWTKGITRAVGLWLVAALGLALPAPASATQWKPGVTIDATAGAGRHVSLAIGGDGKLHTSYLSGSATYNVMYSAALPGGDWGAERATLASNAKVLAGTAIDVDPITYLPHVSYYLGGSKKVQISEKLGGTTWATVLLEGGVTVAADSATSLFRHAGGTHVAYYNSGLSFGNYSSTVKTLGTVDAGTTGAGKYNSASAGVDGRFHVAYHDATSGALMYAWATGVTGPWTKEPVTGVAAGDGRYCSLALDSQGNLHLSYVSAAGTKVRYITRAAGGAWSVPVDIGDSWSAAGKAGFTSIGVDSAGFAHISYYGSSKALMYATNTGGSWSVETVPADAGSTDYGMYSALKLDGNNNLYIAYYDVSQARLKLAATQSAGIIAVTPESLDFGSVTRGASSPRQLTITNSGATTLIISSITLSGSSASQFSTTTCSTLAPGADCSVTVTATPDSGGEKSATLAISSNASNPTLQVALSATSPWQISAQVGNGGNGGSITPAGQIDVEPGQGLSFTMATAGAPFTLAEVLVDQMPVGAVTSYNFANVTSDHSIEAQFVSPIRLFGIPYIYFASLQQAYDAIVEAGTVQSQASLPVAEYLQLNQPVAATLKGGYSADFAGQSGDSTLQGINIIDGNLTPEGLVLQ